jgi:uncharacterized protein Smg (DUF494 family)
MIYILIIGLVLVSIASVTIYIYKRKFFEQHHGVAEFFAIMISLIFTLLALQQAQSSVEQSTEEFNSLISRIDTIITSVGTATNSVESVKQSLAELPVQLDTFSVTINSLNKIVSNQKDKLESVLNDLNNSMSDFRNSLAALSERFNRKPEIKIDLGREDSDSTIRIYSVVLTNNGELAAELQHVKIYLHKEDVISVEWEKAIIDSNHQNEISYMKNLEPIILYPNPNTPILDRFNMILKIGKPRWIRVFLYYKADFGHHDVVNQAFSIP